MDLFCMCLSFSLGAKGKQKADKNRARVEENFLKLTHVQRQEAAQSRREEKKRAEKERIMNEEDPEKQRRLEVKYVFGISPCHCDLDLKSGKWAWLRAC